MRRFKDKVLSLILSLNLIVNSVAPFFILAKPVVSAEPLKADINFKTEENTFSLSLNTTDNVEYVLGWKNQDGLQGTAKTKADSTGQNFIKDIYAGIKSGPDARRDEVVRGIYKIEVKTQSWITAIKFSLTDGILKEEGKQTYTPSGLDFSDDETKWMEEGDPGTSPTPTVTPTPTIEITPTATPTPTVESGQILDGASDQNFMTPNVNGVVETQVIATAQCRADSLNGCLATDKPDYAPTEAVLVTGYGFAPNTVYTLKISSQDEPAVNYEAQITTDKDGAFTASYQLDGNYRPNYLVELKDSNGTVVASITFTDSQEDYRHWQDEGTTAWINGALNDTKSNYFEGEVVPHYWVTKSVHEDNVYGFNIYYDYYWSSGSYCGFDYLSQYNTSRSPAFVGLAPFADASLPEGHGNFYARNADILSVSGPFSDGIQRYVQVKFKALSDGNSEFYWGLHLAVPGSITGCQGARSWPGASLQTDVRNTPSISGANMRGGGGTLQINPSAIIRGSISGYKWSDLNNNGVFDSGEPKLSGWTIKLCSDTTCSTVLQTTTTDASGNYSFNVSPGTYYIGEVQQSGWTKTSPSANTYGPLTVCASTPSFTDKNFGNYQAPTTGYLKVIKHVSGGSAVSTDWTMHVNTVTTQDIISAFPGHESPGDTKTLNPGDYVITESDGPSDYVLTFSGNCDSSGHVTVVAGQTTTCTLTNTYSPTGQITIIKDAVPNSDSFDFNFTASGSGLTNFTLDDDDNPTYSNTQTFTGLAAGVYLVTEAGVDGWQLTDITCSGTGSTTKDLANGKTSITLGAGQNVTCTYTNSKLPKIRIIKTVVGGGDPADFTIHLLDPSGSDVSGSPFQGSTTGTQFQLLPTYTYPATFTIHEEPNSHYVTTFSGVCTQTEATDASATLTWGDNGTCYVTNTKKGHIIVDKVTVPSGSAQSFDFVAGGTGYSNFSLTDSAAPNNQEVVAGAYSVSETPVDGWTSDAGVCDKGETPSSLDVGPGETVTCTFTNSQLPKLTVIKSVTNDNGGTKEYTDFPLFVGTTGVTSGVKNTFAPSDYTVSETGDDAYAATFGGACNSKGQVTLEYGDDKTCTINNNDKPAHLIVIKHVDNDNGGTATASAFTMTINTVTAEGGNSFPGSESPGTDKTLLSVGSYSVSETGPDGYTPSYSADCSGIIALNQTKTCTVTNDDQAATLIVKKVVVNDNGGGKTASNFSFSVNGGTAIAFESDGQNDVSVPAGTYSVVEPGVTGYATSYENCSDLVIPNGGTATCTITNDDIAPSLILNKIISNNNGGTAEESDWTLTADGGTAGLLSGPGASGSADVVSGPLFKTGTYVLSESAGPDGYTASDWSCVKNRGEAVDGNSITLDVGDLAVCSITNDDIQPKLIVHKTVIGGSATVFDFDYFVDYPKGSVQVESGEENGYDAGTYNVMEVNNSGFGYTATFGGACDPEGNVTLTVGDETKTCEITNTRDVGSLEVNKKVDSDGNGTYEGGNSEANVLGFQWGTDSKTTDESMGTTKNDLETNNYNVYENDVTDYHFAGWYYTNGEGSCVDPDGRDLPANITVSKDLTTSITLCNARDTGSITVDKITDPEGDSQLFTIRLKQGETGIHDYVLSDSSEPETKKLLTGDYSLTELAQDGWDLTSSYCFVNEGETQTYVPGDTLSLGYGDNIYCTFENTKRGSVTVTKYNDKNGNGKRDEDENVLSGWDMTIAQQGKSLKETTGSNGNAVFANVIPGDYVLSETIKDNWTQTNISCSTDFNDERVSDTIDSDNNHGLTVSAGANTICEVGNRPINPELQISKSNDGGNKLPGDLVTYTIKIKALNSQVLGVILKDLLPKGFAFQNVISIIKNGSDDLTAEVGDPHYHSPGTYNLGDMDPDDEIIIRYVAKIDGSQEFGLYKDIAWAKGTDFLSNKVLATAQDGYVDTNFVGTEVRVNGNLTESGNATVTEEGQVLGASTSILPATGANGIWVLIASLLSAMGLLILAIWFVISHKKGKIFMKKLIIITMFAAGLFLGGQVHASDLSIRLSEPKTPTKNTDFKLVFTVLDLTESGNPITAKCFYKKTLSDGWTQFDSDKTLSAGGNTDSCQVNSGIVNASGHTYYFKATATNGESGDDTESQGLVSVTYDNSDPGAPTNYKKEKIGSCQYKISFKTANDGMTTRVEIYRSDSTSMALDGSTRVGDMTVGPNTESSFTESVPDCNKTYYYVIRAFNEAGNGSGPIGDSVVITTTTTSITTQESGAIPVSNVTLPGGGGSGQVLGEQNKASTPEASPTLTMEEINVKGASTSNVVGSFVSKNKKLLAALLILILAIIVYVFIRIKNRK